MPTRIANSPGRIPLQRLILKLGFSEPQNEVISVFLIGILLHAIANTYGQILLIVVIKDLVLV